MNVRIIPLLTLLLLLVTPASSPAAATGDDAAGSGVVELIDILREKGILTPEEARAIAGRVREQQAAGAGKTEEAHAEKEAGEVDEKVESLERDVRLTTEEMLRRTRVNEHEIELVKWRIEEEVYERMNKSAWSERIRWGGDVRVRYQGEFYDDKNAELLEPSDPDTLMNTRINRHRARVRARIAVKAVVNDPKNINEFGKVEVGVRLTTGNDKNPVSTNKTMGDYYARDGVVMDQAYLKWSYTPMMPIWGGKEPKVALLAGRFSNPFYSTNLVWDTDLGLEGIALTGATDTFLGRKWNLFSSIGAFPLQEVEFADEDKYMYGAQFGATFFPTLDLAFTVAAALYEFENVTGSANAVGRPNELDYTAPLYQQKGNTLFDINPNQGIRTALAADFREFNLTGEARLAQFQPVIVKFTADYVNNIGFDKADVIRRTGNPDVDSATEGFMVGVTVGHENPVSKGAWNTSLQYRYLEADAVLDAFTDSDFHMGGANNQGWVLGGNYGLGGNFWLSGKYLTSDEIDGPPLAIDVLQLDLNGKF
ncbi:MAG: putative porin [Desulfatibacillaceae bacterium]